MSKFGPAKAINHEKIWRSAMNIEYLVQEEVGDMRRPYDELLVELIDGRGVQKTHFISYVSLPGRNYRNQWPALTTIEPQPGICQDLLTLVEGDATHEALYPNRRKSAYGAEVVKSYLERMEHLERALRDPAMKHYVEFEQPQAYNFGNTAF